MTERDVLREVHDYVTSRLEEFQRTVIPGERTKNIGKLLTAFNNQRNRVDEEYKNAMGNKP